MINYVAYRKFATLKNGKRVMFRFLNEQDGEALIQLFQEAPEEDIRFLKQNVKDVKLVNYWIDHLNYRKVFLKVDEEVKFQAVVDVLDAIRVSSDTAKKKSLGQLDKFQGQDGGDVKVAVSLKKRIEAAPVS